MPRLFFIAGKAWNQSTAYSFNFNGSVGDVPTGTKAEDSIIAYAPPKRRQTCAKEYPK